LEKEFPDLAPTTLDKIYEYFESIFLGNASTTVSGFSAFKAANQPTTSGVVATIGGWTTATPGYDDITGFDTTTGEFTSPVAGNFDVKICIIWQPSNQGNVRIVQYQVNNAPQLGQVGDPALVTRYLLGHSLIMYITGVV